MQRKRNERKKTGADIVNIRLQWCMHMFSSVACLDFLMIRMLFPLASAFRCWVVGWRAAPISAFFFVLRFDAAFSCPDFAPFRSTKNKISFAAGSRLARQVVEMKIANGWVRHRLSECHLDSLCCIVAGGSRLLHILQ